MDFRGTYLRFLPAELFGILAMLSGNFEIILRVLEKQNTKDQDELRKLVTYVYSTNRTSNYNDLVQFHNLRCISIPIDASYFDSLIFNTKIEKFIIKGNNLKFIGLLRLNKSRFVRVLTENNKLCCEYENSVLRIVSSEYSPCMSRDCTNVLIEPDNNIETIHLMLPSYKKNFDNLLSLLLDSRLIMELKILPIIESYASYITFKGNLENLTDNVCKNLKKFGATKILEMPFYINSLNWKEVSSKVVKFYPRVVEYHFISYEKLDYSILQDLFAKLRQKNKNFAFWVIDENQDYYNNMNLNICRLVGFPYYQKEPKNIYDLDEKIGQRLKSRPF